MEDIIIMMKINDRIILSLFDKLDHLSYNIEE